MGLPLRRSGEPMAWNWLTQVRSWELGSPRGRFTRRQQFPLIPHLEFSPDFNVSKTSCSPTSSTMSIPLYIGVWGWGPARELLSHAFLWLEMDRFAVRWRSGGDPLEIRWRSGGDVSPVVLRIFFAIKCRQEHRIFDKSGIKPDETMLRIHF